MTMQPTSQLEDIAMELDKKFLPFPVDRLDSEKIIYAGDLYSTLQRLKKGKDAN